MKKTYGLLCMAVLLTACGGNEEVTGTKSVISGTYVRQAESEYSKATATLIVTPYDAKAGTFIILRRTGFHRIKKANFNLRRTSRNV